MSDERIEELGLPRRQFLKKVGAAAFAAPVVVSFALDGVAEAASRRPGHWQPNQAWPNQHHPNQACPNQHHPNQAWPNQHHPNQAWPNQAWPNQAWHNQAWHNHHRHHDR